MTQADAVANPDTTANPDASPTAADGAVTADSLEVADAAADVLLPGDGNISETALADAAGVEAGTPDTAADEVLAQTDAVMLPDTAADSAADGVDASEIPTDVQSASPDTDVAVGDQAVAPADAAAGPPVWNPKPGPADKKLLFEGATLQPWTDTILCWYVPPDGQDHWATAFDATFVASIHHLRVDRILDTVGKKAFGPVDCMDKADGSPDEPGWMTTAELPGSGTKSAQIQFPPGFAFKIGKEHGLYYELHVSNESDVPKLVQGFYQIYTTPEQQVTTSLGLLMHFNQKLQFSPGVATQVSTCKISQDINVLFGTGHIHYYGKDLTYTVNGTTIYQTDKIVDVPFVQWPMPGFVIKKGDTLSVSCTYNNPLKTSLVNGYSNTLNAMCGFVGYFYPTVDSKPIYCM